MFLRQSAPYYNTHAREDVVSIHDGAVTVGTTVPSLVSSDVMSCAGIGGSLMHPLLHSTDSGSVDPYLIMVLNGRTIWHWNNAEWQGA